MIIIKLDRHQVLKLIDIFRHSHDSTMGEFDIIEFSQGCDLISNICQFLIVSHCKFLQFSKNYQRSNVGETIVV